jgi:hypothetical protein
MTRDRPTCPTRDRWAAVALTRLSPGQAPRPETASLRAFQGLNPNGTWQLYVVDADAEAGIIACWSLTFKARVRR